MGRRSGQYARGPLLLIVIDTSVWIDHFRNTLTPQVNWLRTDAVYHGPIIVGDVVLLEVLQGVANEAKAVSTESLLRSFDILPMLDGDTAVRAARNYRMLRSRGVAIRKTVDLIIGTFCLDRGWPLLHDDGDFDHMERHLGLAVVHA